MSAANSESVIRRDQTAAHLPSSMDVIDPPDRLDEAHSSFSSRGLLHVIFKHKWLIGISFVASTVAATLFALFMLDKPGYTATAQLMVASNRESIPNIGFGSAGLEQTARASELLAGRTLAEQVVKEIGARELYNKQGDSRLGKFMWWLSVGQPDPQREFESAVSRFARNLKVESTGRSSILTVKFEHEDPELAAKVVNKLTDLFIGRHLSVQANPRAAAFLEDQFESAKVGRQASEERLQTFRQRQGIATSIPDEIKSVEGQLTAARSALHDTRKQIRELSTRLAEARTQLSNTSTEAGPIKITREKLAALELEEQELLVRMTPENPTLRAVQENIRMVRNKLAQMDASKPYGTSAPDLHGQVQAEMLRDVALQKGLQSREQAEAAKVKELERRVDALRDANIQFGHLQQEFQLAEQNHRLYQSKLEELRISNAMDVEKIANIKVIEPAQVPVLPQPSKKRMIVGLGALAGLAGGIALAFALRFVTGCLDTAADVEQHLALPVLASIPLLSLEEGSRLKLRRSSWSDAESGATDA